MSDDDLDPVSRWRKKVAEARAAEQELTDPVALKIMRTIAEGYERLAERAQARQSRKNPIDE